MLNVTLRPIQCNWKYHIYKYLPTTADRQKKENSFVENNPSRRGEKSIILKWWWCHFEKEQLPRPKWNQNFLRRLSFSYAMPVIDAEIFPKPTEKTCSSLVETIPHFDQKRPSFHRAANPPTHNTLSPSCSLWFSLKTNSEIGCRPADCFELHPQKGQTERWSALFGPQK